MFKTHHDHPTKPKLQLQAFNFKPWSSKPLQLAWPTDRYTLGMEIWRTLSPFRIQV